MRCADVGLAFIQRAIPGKLPLTLDAGHVDGRWQLALLHERNTGQADCQMTIAADIRDARGTLKLDKTVPYHISQGHICLADHALQLMQMHGEIGGVPAELNGEITYVPTTGVCPAVADFRR